MHLPRSRGGKVTVVICDDDWLTCRALRFVLDEPGIIIQATCQTAEECLRAVRESPPHVAIIDLQLNGDPRAGVELIRQVRIVSPSTLCLVLTATDTIGELLPDAYAAGAHGFQRKGYISGTELPALIKRMVAGDWEIDRELAGALIRRLVAKDRPAPGHARGVCLMPSEAKVLHLLADGCNAQAIAGELQVPADVVKSHIRNITGKYHQASPAVMTLCYAAEPGH